MSDFQRFDFHFHHNFSKSARIEIRFGTVAKLEKLNNFSLDRIEDCRCKNLSIRVFAGDLARARARPSRARGASGPYPEGVSKDLSDRARVRFP